MEVVNYLHLLFPRKKQIAHLVRHTALLSSVQTRMGRIPENTLEKAHEKSKLGHASRNETKDITKQARKFIYTLTTDSEVSTPIRRSSSEAKSRNGIRLRFDGPDQRLRLIEVLDLSKTRLVYKTTDLVKLPETTGPETTPSSPSGPAFRHVYNRFLSIALSQV